MSSNSLKSMLKFFLLDIVLTHMNAHDQQTAKPAAFIEVLLPADDQVKQAHLIISKLAATCPLNSSGSIKVYL